MKHLVQAGRVTEEDMDYNLIAALRVIEQLSREQRDRLHLPTPTELADLFREEETKS